MNDVSVRTPVPVGTIVVGVDAHDTWQGAVDWAADQALLERRPVTLVHVADTQEQLWHDAQGHERRIGVEPATTTAEQVLGLAAARVRSRAPGVPVHAVRHTGGVRGTLHAVARDAHLLVVGSRQRRTLWSTLFGTSGSSIAHRPPCPTVVAHVAHHVRPRQGVLVGIDDTDHSRAPLRFAFQQASWRGLPLEIVHVALEPTYGATHDEPEQQLEMAEAIAGLREEFPDVAVHTTIARGDPSEGLLRAGRDKHLVVVGAHHRRPMSELQFGSVVAPVVERATCPVAVVPHQGARVGS